MLTSKTYQVGSEKLKHINYIYIFKGAGELNDIKDNVENIINPCKIIETLSNIGINITLNEIKSDVILLKNPKGRSKFLPKESDIQIAPMMGAVDLLKMIGLQIDFFKGKNVTDIGGGFTALPFLLQNIVSTLSLVDPCYKGDIKFLAKKSYEKHKLWKNDIYDGLKYHDKKIKLLSNELEKYVDDFSVKGKHIYYGLMQEINKKEGYKKRFNKNILNREKAIQELQKWFDFDTKLDQSKVNLNASIGERIIGVDDNSQDIVFINHLLTKKNVNPYLILSEAARIVKKGGEIIVVNDVTTENDDIFTLLGKNNIQINKNSHRLKIWFRITKN